uniref:G_PROTEIN_RECEP_F1_2 domain-containing protein n=1 Tax=Heligmosomoides polygyrus TaxID=6339 RepID=A0A183FD79_HELPZ
LKSVTNPIQLFTTLTLFVTSVTIPALILYWRRLILKTINTSQQSHSEKAKYNSKKFLKALTAQAVVPLICLVPTGMLYIVMQFLNYNIVFLQYMFPMVTMLPCAIDPLCSIYFITPYRAWVLKKLRTFSTSWGLRTICFPNGNATRSTIDSNKF